MFYKSCRRSRRAENNYILAAAPREQLSCKKTEYLRNIESLIGFKRGILSDVEMAERTATEITSSDGDYNLTITDLQEVWERAVRDAVQLCSELARIYKMPGAAKVNDEDVIIDLVMAYCTIVIRHGTNTAVWCKWGL